MRRLMVAGCTSLLSFAALGQERGEFGGGLSFVLGVDLDGDAQEEVLVGTRALGADKVSEFRTLGDVCVYERLGEQDPALHEAFSALSAVPADPQPEFFEASVVTVDDIDQGGLAEVVLVWLGQFWWPAAYRPLAVVEFDRAIAGYRMAFEVRRAVCEIGTYVAENVDGYGRVELIEVSPVYGTEVDGVTGREEGECHFCPHRYRIVVFEFDGGFIADPSFNGREPFITAETYLPGLGKDMVSDFLPQLMATVRRLVGFE